MVTGDDEVEKMERELGRVDELLWSHYEELRGSWTFRLGPISMTSNFRSTAITKVYMMFIVLCAMVGGVLTFVESTKELGIALLAGAILAFGSFASQFWAIAVQRDRAFQDTLLTRVKHRELEALWKRRDALGERIEKLRGGLATGDY